MFTQGQRVWTPEFGWVKYERELQHTPDTSYDSKLRFIKTSTILLDTPDLPTKEPRISLGNLLLAGEALPPLTTEEAPTFTELLHAWSLVESVRVLAPARIEDAVKRLFDRLGIEYPGDWRGTEFGKRGGTEEQRTLASTVVLKDGRTFNSLRLTLQLLSEGRAEGWRVTKSA